MNLSQSLRHWYSTSARNLPWRNTTNPYLIWLSEIILQQTRVAQGLPYFEKFIAEFPSVEDLANADSDKVMKLWEGLGYYSRARNLHKGAKFIAANGFPTQYQEWLQVPGVGPYTASAVASFAYGEEKAVVDGNVHRVLSRLMALDIPVNSSLGAKRIQEKADELIHNQPPADHNQAIMELGAIICKPKNPECDKCPWNHDCLAYAVGSQEKYPIKTKKTKVTERTLNYTAIYGPSGMFIRQRTGNDIWQGLYELVPEKTSDLVLGKHHVETSLYEVTHLLSHRRLVIRIESVEWQGPMPSEWNHFKLYSWTEIKDLAFPKPLRSWLNNNLLPLSLGSES